MPMGCWTSANWRGGLGSKYYPTFLHCQQMDVACLSKYLLFSNWGRKQKFIALFFKALTQHIFKCVCNTLFLPISFNFDAIYSLQEREWGEPNWWWKTVGKPAFHPGFCPPWLLLGGWSGAMLLLQTEVQTSFDWLAPVTKAWDLGNTQTMLCSSENS